MKFLLIAVLLIVAAETTKSQVTSDHEQRLEMHNDLLNQAITLKNVFAIAPFAFLLAPGPQLEEGPLRQARSITEATEKARSVYEFDWVAYANACADLNKIIIEKLYRDAAENCAQTSGKSATFWCKLAETYQKSMN